MKKTISNHDFRQAFTDYGRGSQFSADALDALFDYFQDWEDSTGEELELDVIAICCDWGEYDGAYEALFPESEENSWSESECVERLRESTVVIELDDSVLVQNF